MAKMNDDDKIISDRAKVNRELKDDLDCILEHCTDDEWVNRLAWQFQSSGTNAQLNTIHLCGNGLYVVLKRFDIILPTTINELYGIIKVVTAYSHGVIICIEPVIFKYQKSKNNTIFQRASKAYQQLIVYYSVIPPIPPKKAIWRKPSNLYIWTFTHPGL
ncbi:hypothetical protein BDC45DRAFT_516990 [Circinella umbellata]|nr:hypothetical protein BDC45DRAFT_516990 [Circinella umbellata]